MILILDVCSDKLSEIEFVKPIKRILERGGIRCFTKHYLELNSEELLQADGVVICDTALEDFGYLKQLDLFRWVVGYNRPILGICAGMQIIGILFGCSVVDRVMIGQFKVSLIKENKLASKKGFYSYFSNTKVIIPNENFVSIAKVYGVDCIIKHREKDVYGCLFHPEVLNEEIISNFCRIVL
ncbi:MAG: hypothetical protein QXJ17_01580 [Nitrososphaeria archaeon]